MSVPVSGWGSDEDGDGGERLRRLKNNAEFD